MDQAEERRLYGKALRSLSRREHSRLQLLQKLKRDCSDAALVEAVLDRLTEDGLLSDVRFAESLCLSRIGRGYGEFYIRRELANKGVNIEIVSEVLSQVLEAQGSDWPALAEAVAQRRFPHFARDTTSWHKACRFLNRRGFSAGDIRAVLGPIPDAAGTAQNEAPA